MREGIFLGRTHLGISLDRVSVLQHRGDGNQNHLRTLDQFHQVQTLHPIRILRVP